MAEWKKIIVSGSGVAQLSNDANYLTDYTVTSGDVTAHEGDITITESQISDLGTYSTATGVENNADVTDTANVTAAGALMDSELTDLAGIKALTVSSKQDVLSEGAFVDGDKTKLDGIEASADVTDTANVTAAGALMDSEVTNLAQVKAFDSSDYATAAQGDKADTAIQPSDSVTDLSDVSSVGSGAIITAAERGSIGALNTFTGSLNANFATDSELSAVSGALASDLSSIDTAVPAIVDNSGTPAFNSGITKTEVLSILNVEDGADVTDTANVTAAGALMDSELTDLAGVKGVTISTLQVKPSEGAFADGDKTKLDGIEASADVTDTANVTAAGALMDSEVDADLKTFSLPANTTISTFGKTLVDDADASAARGTLGLGSIATLSAIDISSNTNLAVSDTTGQTGINLTLSGDTISGVVSGLGTGASPQFTDLTVTGDLTVSGTTTTIDVANLNVTDQFINLNDGGSAADGGIVVEGAGVSFGWANDQGRWAFDASGATEGQTTITEDAFAAAVVTSDLAAYRKNGNIRVTGGEIFIYTE